MATGTSMTVATVGLMVFWTSALYLVTALFGNGHGQATGE